MWWLWTIIIFCLLAFLYWWGKQPIYFKNISLEGLEYYISQLFEVGEAGSILIADHQGSDSFLQFALTETNKNSITFEFGLPEMDWSRPYFSKVQKLADSEGFSTLVENSSENINTPVHRFLRISASSSVSEATELARRLYMLVAKAICLTNEARFKVHLEGNCAGPRASRVSLKNLNKIDSNSRILNYIKRSHEKKIKLQK